MKKIYLFILCTASMIKLQAQNFDWAKLEGLYAYDYGYGITNDNNGNIYVAGKYEQINANFSSTLLPCQGNHDIFLAKYTSGGALSWVRTGGGTLGDYAHAIACDKTSNVFIAGEIEGYGNQIVFPGSTITLNSIGTNDIFLANYDLSGTLLWAKSAGYVYNDKALGVTYDNSGNVYICGLFTDTAYFGTTPIYGHGAEDMFVAKYNSSGVFQWAREAGSTGRDEAKSIMCDAAGNIYVCGMFSNGNSGAVFGTQTLNCTPGYFDTFLAKYSSSGSLLWVKTGGGAYDDLAWSLTLDNAGKIYITGEYNGYANFGGIYLTTAGQAQAFVACYDAAGTVQWAKAAGDTNPTGAMVTRARGIGCDGNNLYITGQFGGAATFGTFNLTAADSSDVFFASMDGGGNFLKAAAVGGAADAIETLGYESGNAICAEPGGVAYATGALLNGGICGTTTLTAYARTDVFITRISSMTTSDNDLASDQKNISVYPNPNNGNFTIALNGLQNQKTETSIFNCLGQKVYARACVSPKTDVDLSTVGKGIYFIEVKAENNSVSRGKIIIQ